MRLITGMSALMPVGGSLHAELPAKRVLTLDAAKKIASAAEAEAIKRGATPLQSGIPIVVDGRVIGAIGVSGNTPHEDEDIAKTGAAATAAVTSDGGGQ